MLEPGRRRRRGPARSARCGAPGSPPGGERPDLVLDRPGGLLEERPQGAQRRAGRLGARDQVFLQRRPGLQRESIGAGQRALGLLERAGQLPDRAADRGLLRANEASAAFGGVDEVGQVLVLVAELGARAAGSCGSSWRCSARRMASAPLMRAMSRAKGSRRRSALESFTSRPLRRVEGLGAVRQQQLEELLGVGVERGEDLVRIDLRLRSRRAGWSSPP